MNNLNILNGESLKRYLIDNNLLNPEDTISFNECLVEGPIHENIFSEEFFRVREAFITEYFSVTPEVFREKSRELDLLLNDSYENITLWFDSDMFCQINLLALLGYMDFVGYRGKVTVCIIKQTFYKCTDLKDVVEKDIVLPSLANFYDLYVDVLIKKDFEILDKDTYKNIFKLLPELRSGIGLFSHYNHPNNEIREFVRLNKDMDKKEILLALLKRFNNYGLGDTQYMRIIDEMRTKL